MTEPTLLNILLVEDDKVDVKNVERALRKNKLSNPLFVASNGLDALQMLRDGTVSGGRQLILLDLNMPKMNGFEFLRELRADPALSNSTVIVLTTSNDDRGKVAASGLHVAGYLLKPVTFLTFVELTAALNKHWVLVERP